MSYRDLFFKQQLYKREDGSHYLFSEEKFSDHLTRAMSAIAAYNSLSRALSQFEDIEDKAKKKDYLLGIITEGGDHIRNEYRKTLEKELKGISFFRAKRAALIEESIDAIPTEIFETIEKYLSEARRESAGIARPVTAEDLTFTLADDKSCLWVGLSKKYEEGLRAALVQDVPEERIKICEKFIEAVSMLQDIAREGAHLGGNVNPSGVITSGIVEGFVVPNAEGEFKPLELGDIVTRIYIKPRK